MIAPLTTVARLQPMLGVVSPAQQASLPGLIEAASLMAEKYCNRHFAQNDYVEFRNGTLDNSLILFNFPVNSISRIAANLDTVMVIKNNNSAHQRAMASLLTTGTQYDGWTVQGVNLTWIASGVPGSQLFPLSSYPTFDSLRTAIDAFGNGWSANVDTLYTLWPTSDLYPIKGSSSAKGSGCQLQIHKSDLSDFDVDPAIGEVRVSDWFGASFYSYTNYPWVSPWGSPGWRSVRVEYNAGYAVIPDDIQEAVCLIAKMLFDIHANSMVATRVKLFDYEIELKPLLNSIPESARTILALYKDYRASGD